MLEKITVSLNNRADISAWQVTRVAKKSNQLFMIRTGVESVRHVENVKYHVTVHQERVQDGRKVLGESGFVFIEGDDLDAKLELAVGMSGGVSNQPWSLPGPEQKYMGAEIKDKTIELSADKVINKVKEEILHAVERLGDVRLSSSEVFADYREFTLVNSMGLRAEESDTEILWDFVLLTGEGQDEVESSGYKTVRFYKDLKVGETLGQYARYARESLTAGLPENGTFDVVFGAEALDHLFDTFVAHSGGSAAYNGWSRYEEGKPVIENPEGELLTLYSNPQIPGLMSSGPFDAEGLAKKQVEVISSNVFKKRTLDKRYADYLGGAPTGSFSNVEVSTGAKSVDELLTDGCYYLLRFSTFEPNPVTGNFSGEIRTGYKIQDGKRIPIKGGAVAGDIHDAFRRAWFSSEKTTRSKYRGPVAVKLAALEIGGE